MAKMNDCEDIQWVANKILMWRKIPEKHEMAKNTTKRNSEQIRETNGWKNGIRQQTSRH